MTHEEHYELGEILKGDPWLVRKRLLEFMKTVKVEEITQNVSGVEEGGIEVSTGLVAPHRTLLNGDSLPDYPEYMGPPTI